MDAGPQIGVLENPAPGSLSFTPAMPDELCPCASGESLALGTTPERELVVLPGVQRTVSCLFMRS